MRRGRKASSIRVSPVVLRSSRRRASEPEAPADSSSSSSLELSTSGATSPGDPERRTPTPPPPPGRAEEPPPPASDQASEALQPEPEEAPEETADATTMLSFFQSIPTEMDYKGQKLAEQIFQGIIIFSAVIGFICGYITEQFSWTVYIVMVGFAVSCLLTLPPWPMYRRNPLKWLPVQEPATDDKKPAERKVKRHSKN